MRLIALIKSLCFTMSIVAFSGQSKAVESCGYFWVDEGFGPNAPATLCGDHPSLPDWWNDRFTSYQIPPGVDCMVTEHHNFGGWWSLLRAETEQWNMGGMHDQISSVKCAPQGYFESVAPPGLVILYEHAHFAGHQVAVDTRNKAGSAYEPNLGRWHDRISSMKVGSGAICTFFQHVGAGGQGNPNFTVRGPDRLGTLPSGWNDEISSYRCGGE